MGETTLARDYSCQFVALQGRDNVPFMRSEGVENRNLASAYEQPGGCTWQELMVEDLCTSGSTLSRPPSPPHVGERAGRRLRRTGWGSYSAATEMTRDIVFVMRSFLAHSLRSRR